MARARLLEDAFDYYLGLGPARTYQAVAKRFAISKRSVSRRAATEHWQPRLKGLSGALKTEPATTADGEGVDACHATRMSEMQDAVFEVMTPLRMKAVLAALFKAAVQKDDVGAARFLVERTLGKTRNEPLPATAIDIPNGLETTADVRRAANALLQGVTDGSLSPEDAQKTAVVLEAARKSIETEDLEKRIVAIEENIKKERSQ